MKSDFDKRFKRTSSIIHWFIGIIIAIIFAGWIFTGYVSVKIYQNIDFSHGLQGVVNQIWYGEQYK